ncbi:MAG TPA: universal stress protein, partial [Noviherbaspirillum sp.]
QRHGLPRNIMIAWDGSAGASRAVRGALPLLQRSGTVVITIVRPASEDAASPSDPSCALILAYLAHQGVAAAVNTVTTKESVGNVLLGAARSENADLMVMGCYGHSPLKETLFGGATRDVLANPALPLFLSC